jgi:hypothetical protein
MRALSHETHLEHSLEKTLCTKNEIVTGFSIVESGGLRAGDSPLLRRLSLDRILLAAVAMTIFFWASAFVAIRTGLRSYTPTQLAALRYLVASAVLGTRAMFYEIRIPYRRDWPRLLICGCLGFALFAILLNFGETRVSAGLASFIVYTVPLFTALLAAVLLRERIGRLGWIGLGISAAGTALIAFSINRRLQFEPAVISLVAAACSLGLYFVLHFINHCPAIWRSDRHFVVRMEQHRSPNTVRSCQNGLRGAGNLPTVGHLSRCSAHRSRLFDVGLRRSAPAGGPHHCLFVCCPGHRNRDRIRLPRGAACAARHCWRADRHHGSRISKSPEHFARWPGP